jgi:hypothetical protein
MKATSARAAMLLGILTLLFCLGSPRARAAAQTKEDLETASALKGIAILPSVTDSRITEFDTPHIIMVNRKIVVHRDPRLPAERHQLLVYLPGTQPGKKDAEQQPRGGNRAYLRTAVMLGYHVIILRYPNDLAANVCRNETDPTAYEDFRMAIIAGGKSKFITVSRVNSIENRLVKLLRHLKAKRPLEKWQQFLEADGDIKWKTIAVAGHSQGGGHAALIAINHRVARVICTGAPKDFSRALKAPAAWYAKKSATPKTCFFAFNHQQDKTTCSPEEQLANLRALGLGVGWPLVDVDKLRPPYNHARVLTTNHPGTRLDPKAAHAAVIISDNEKVFGRAWQYLFTEPTR